jgi:hypothetical protein
MAVVMSGLDSRDEGVRRKVSSQRSISSSLLQLRLNREIADGLILSLRRLSFSLTASIHRSLLCNSTVSSRPFLRFPSG